MCWLWYRCMQPSCLPPWEALSRRACPLQDAQRFATFQRSVKNVVKVNNDPTTEVGPASSAAFQRVSKTAIGGISSKNLLCLLTALFVDSSARLHDSWAQTPTTRNVAAAAMQHWAGLTLFAATSNREFSNMLMQNHEPPPLRDQQEANSSSYSSSRAARPRASYPSAKDWAADAGVTAVRDQGGVSDCHALCALCVLW